jgi:DNA-binding transcriptional MerR regulator
MEDHMAHDDNDLLTVQDVARLDGDVCAATVRAWERSGKLPAIRTASGMRLFRRADADRVISERRRARQNGGR